MEGAWERQIETEHIVLKQQRNRNRQIMPRSAYPLLIRQKDQMLSRTTEIGNFTCLLVDCSSWDEVHERQVDEW